MSEIAEQQPAVDEKPAPTGRRWIVWLCAATIAAAALYAINSYVALNRKVHIVNGLEAVLSVSVDGDESVAVPPESVVAVTLAEGDHRATIRMGKAGEKDSWEETIEFSVRSGWLARFSDKPAWVLNPRGAAVLLHERGTGKKEHERRFLFGEKFLKLDGVDYVFSDFHRILAPRKMRLSMVPTAGGMLHALVGAIPPHDRLRFVEHFMGLRPRDEALVRIYTLTGLTMDEAARCAEFLEKGLNARPVAVEWHRSYQTIRQIQGRIEETVRLYDRMLEKESGDSLLMYLRGRISPRAEEAIGWYDKAIAADPSNPYPLFARAYHMAGRGEFAAARESCSAAVKLNPSFPGAERLLFEMRFALGEFEALEKETKGLQASNPSDPDLNLRRIAIRAAMGDMAGARKVHEEYCEAVKNDSRSGALRSVSLLNLLYMSGDLDGMLREVSEMGGSPLAGAVEFHVGIEKGAPEKCEPRAGNDWSEGAASSCLLVAIAWHLKGDVEKAASWRKKAADMLVQGMPDRRRAASLLNKGASATIEDALGTVMMPSEKAVVLTALAGCSPLSEAEILELADKLNFYPVFPHRFLKRAVAAMRSGSEGRPGAGGESGADAKPGIVGKQ